MALDNSTLKVKQFIKARKANYPVLMANRTTVEGFGGIVGVPTSFLVNQKGIIVKRYVGYIDKNTLRRDVAGLTQ